MEVITVQNQYNTDQCYTNNINSNQIKDWLPILNNKVRVQQEKLKSKDKQKYQQQQQQQQQQNQQQQLLNLRNEQQQYTYDTGDYTTGNQANEMIINDLSRRLLSELRVAKIRHLTCTEVSIPNDLTTRIASDILRISEREPCGIRGCTIYVEYEEQPNNSRRIAKLKLDKECVSTFEVYLTLKQDKRGWVNLFSQLMRGLSRTITISPEYKLTKRKLYSHDSN